MIPNLIKAVGDLAAVHQVNVTSDLNGRITDIMFTAGSTVKAGQPLVQLFDGPEQGDLASFKAQATVAQLNARPRQAVGLAPVRSAGDGRYRAGGVRPGPGRHRQTEAIISQKLVRAPFDGVLGVRRVEVGQYLTAGTQIVSLTDLSSGLCQLHRDRKGLRASSRSARPCASRSMPIPAASFEGKLTTIEPQISTDTRNIRVQATIANPDRILKPGMFATTTVVLPDKPAVITVPETAVDYTLYGDFGLPDHREEDG